MTRSVRESFLGPKVDVQQVSRQLGLSPDLWSVTWRIRNAGRQPLRLVAARLPHGRFRGSEVRLEPEWEVPPGHSRSLELSVACRGHPGEAVENAFLILQVLWSGQPWRILVRMTVEFDDRGEPGTKTELVTQHPVGFSVGEMPAT